MSLKDKLKSDLTESIRNRDELKSSTIRMILTSITNEEVSGKEARTLTDAETVTVLTREAKKRREAAEAFEQGGAKDRAERERAEGHVIATYLPSQLNEEELASLIKEAISSTGASGLQGLGLVMKFLQPKVAGRADGAKVSAAVKEALSAQS
jgi:uncharacterized protein YqeY